MKRILLVSAALSTALLMLPMAAAFEAHVVNVTATISNALNVPVSELSFGNVFPQEILDQNIPVGLSASFLASGRVDDVSYFIRQKPKCGVIESGAGTIDSPYTYSSFPQVGEDAQGNFVCPNGSVELPLLCPYLSKHETTTDGTGGENDGTGQPSFHGTTDPAEWTLALAKTFDVFGHLVKSTGDTQDNWDIDLHTPCFVGECAQDWATFVTTANPSVPPEDAPLWEAPQSDKGQVMGCDLWVEVNGISYPNIGCNKQIDLMLVLDKSGSIDATKLTNLKTAANGLVTTLAPSSSGNHIGETSFNAAANTDVDLTGVEGNVHTAINALVASGLTNLAAGISTAQASFNISDPNERPAVPNFMIVITDGNPTFPDQATGMANAITAANAAKAAGTTIFVVGVGADVDASFLQNSIASDPAHYFAVADYSQLQTALNGIAQCQNPTP